MNIALILSGGTGNRLGADIPKQYIKVGGRPVIGYCIGCLLKHSRIDALQIVAAPAWQERISGWLAADGWGAGMEVKRKFRGYSLPGENRQLSILHGLEDIRKYAAGSDWILIHDAARPLLSPQLIEECLEAAKGHEGAIPVLPMKDTVYSSADGHRVSSLLNRGEIFAGQAPEVFRLGKYYEANARLLPEKILAVNGSTEPAILAGMDIAMLPGDENNFKITTKTDLDRFTQLALHPIGN